MLAVSSWSACDPPSMTSRGSPAAFKLSSGSICEESCEESLICAAIASSCRRRDGDTATLNAPALNAISIDSCPCTGASAWSAVASAPNGGSNGAGGSVNPRKLSSTLTRTKNTSI